MRAKTHADPTTKDGRNVDPALGTLSGEGAQIAVKGPTQDAYPTRTTVEERPAHLAQTAGSPTYYDLPLLKEPVWKAAIPLYFYTGGCAGGAAALGAAVQLVGGEELRPLVKRCQWIAAGMSVVSGALLVEDLGRPSRFHHMLRVFRPTSPMSVGTWIFTGFGAATTAAALFQGRQGPLDGVGQAAGVGAGALGLGMATYTAVLLSNTAVPAWQAGHRELPLLFATGAAAAAASLLDLFDASPAERRVVRLFAVGAQTAELVASHRYEKALRREPEGARFLTEGLAGAFHTASKVCTAASLALSLLPGDQQWKRRASGVLGTLGAIGLRFAVFQAGRASTRDPRAAFHRQRAGFGGEEVTGQAAVAGPHDARATDPRSQLPARASGGLL